MGDVCARDLQNRRWFGQRALPCHSGRSLRSLLYSGAGQRMPRSFRRTLGFDSNGVLAGDSRNFSDRHRDEESSGASSLRSLCDSANRNAVVGMMRVFKALAEEYCRVTHTFRALNDAEAWYYPANPSRVGLIEKRPCIPGRDMVNPYTSDDHLLIRGSIGGR